LKEKDRAPAPARTQAPKKAEEKPKGKSTNHNVFACLDSDSEEEEKPVVKEEFPTLCVPALTRTQSVSTNYAAALSRPAPPKPVASVVSLPVIQSAKVESKIEAKVAPWASGASKASTMNWAAWDSESEDDEDESPCCWDNQTVEHMNSYDPYKPYAIGDEDETW
jgi:hypothetical protein